MDAEKDNPPSKGSKSRGTLLRSVHIAEGAHPERSGRSTPSKRGVSAAPSASILKPPSTPTTLSQEEKEAIQKRAEGRAKVPPKFRDSIKRFFFSPTGALKIIRLDTHKGRPKRTYKGSYEATQPPGAVTLESNLAGTLLDAYENPANSFLRRLSPLNSHAVTHFGPHVIIKSGLLNR
ncbi:hypothetical protein Celaphus_00004205 [Cervus elaphus hippelaphus]|uniref:Uncharacterized protein n=1 Tax=Cervus elaphus hippelaphus TaxID=46360 RepID=A0A212DBZ8_CEREH|nr:hypothetical protein Celaphus_00004205 [Cervus elaphus hippelaphus]